MEVVKASNVAVIQCQGRITYGPEAQRLQQTVERLLADRHTCVLDIGGVTQVDAGGLGTLVQLARQARAGGATLSLINMSDSVREVVQMTGLDEVLELASPAPHPASHQAVA